ncbi:ErpC protein [Borreliella bavariensis]|uniref:ErpC protein n=1 Tax=Borreliella bavariensis TaxID=664662 RepID=UPI001C01427C|nr:ErpC protein [Borreliella bavariensis]
MNKKMKIFIICAVFMLISSCKIDTTGKNATGKDAEQNVKGKIQGFLEKILDPVKDKIASNGPIADELAKKLQEEEKVNNGEEENDKAVFLGEESKEDEEENEQAVNLEEKELEVKKETEEDEDKEEIEKQKQEVEKAQERKQRQEEKKRKRQEQRKERRAKNKIKKLTDKIDEISWNIDGIESQTSVKPKAVINKITGPVYDYFTDDNKKAIYKTWGDLEEEDNKGLGKLLKELSDTRHELRTKLNEDNKPYIIDTRRSEPQLKENVSVSEIKSDLDELKSKLEEVKKYLKDSSKFEEIKGYISDSQ